MTTEETYGTMPDNGWWSWWRNDGAPIKCNACLRWLIRVSYHGANVANIAREFGGARSGERGVYHEECAAKLWGDDWRKHVPYNDKRVLL